MDNENRKTEKPNKKEAIKRRITAIALVVIVVGATIQICSRHGVDFGKIFSPSATQTEEKKTETKKKKRLTGFDGEDLDVPYVMGKEDTEYPDSEYAKCSLDEIYCQGIKISDVYYVWDTESGIEQIRFRYAIDDTSSKINLLVRGMVTIKDKFANEMFGIYNALTDNYGSYRSQVITVNLTNSKYTNARGMHFSLQLYVDTTNMAAEYVISVPLEDGTVTPNKDFASDGLKTPYVTGDNANVATTSAFVNECDVTELSSNGIEMSNVYYIVDEENQTEQIRFRYALSDRSCDKTLANDAVVTLIDSDGNIVDGITVKEDLMFDVYLAQNVNIDLSESSYSGALGQSFKVLISVTGTEYTSEYEINIPYLK